MHSPEPRREFGDWLVALQKALDGSGVHCTDISEDTLHYWWLRQRNPVDVVKDERLETDVPMTKRKLTREKWLEGTDMLTAVKTLVELLRKRHPDLTSLQTAEIYLGLARQDLAAAEPVESHTVVPTE